MMLVYYALAVVPPTQTTVKNVISVVVVFFSPNSLNNFIFDDVVFLTIKITFINAI